MPIAVSACAGPELDPRPVGLDSVRAEVDRRDPGAAEVSRRSGARLPSPTAVELSDGVDLTEAEAVALHFHPELRLARKEARIPGARIADAGAWNDPELELEVERILEDVDDEWIVAAGIEFSIPVTGRTLSARRKAMAAHDVALQRARVAEHTALAQLRVAWIRWSSTAAELALVQDLLGELDRVASIATVLRDAGSLRTTEARVFQIAIARRRAEAEELEVRLRDERAEVLAGMGLSPIAGVSLVPSMGLDSVPGDPANDPDDLSRSASILAGSHPRLALLRAELRLTGDELDLARREFMEDPGITPGYAFEEGEHRATLGARVPLPIWNANRSEIAGAAASRDAARLALRAAYESLLVDLQRARWSLTAARARRRRLEDEVVPLIEEQRRETRLEAEGGDLDAILLRETLVAAHEAAVDVLRARRDEALAAAALTALLTPAPDADPDASDPEPGSTP